MPVFCDKLFLKQLGISLKSVKGFYKWPMEKISSKRDMED